MGSTNRKKLYWITMLSGIFSVSSYVFLFTHQDWVTRNFTAGGIYAALPIGTAFYFSVVHGAFTSCLLQVFGLRVATGTATNKKQAASVISQSEVQS